MRSVRHLPEGTPWPQGYSGRELHGLMPGGVAEVSDGTFSYLTSEYPAHFVEVAAVPVAPAPEPEAAPSASPEPKRALRKPRG